MKSQFCWRARKTRYRDKEEAKHAMHRRLTSEDNPPAFLRVYQCEYCRGHHLTSKRLLRSEQRLLEATA